MFHAARKYASHVSIFGSQVNKKGDDLIPSPSRVYLLSSPGFAKRSTTAVATSSESGSLQLAASAARPKPFSFTGRAKG